MPPVSVTRIQPDDNGGFYIEWRDAANIDEKPVTGFFHLTQESLADLIVGQRRPNKAPQDKLEAVYTRLVEKAPQALVAQAFRAAYEEVLTDRLDRHKLGLKAVTRHGHEDLKAVRQGAPVRPWNAKDPRTEGFKEFIR
jgi:hypothetical protein